jgi:hypothetical protein
LQYSAIAEPFSVASTGAVPASHQWMKRLALQDLAGLSQRHGVDQPLDTKVDRRMLSVTQIE